MPTSAATSSTRVPRYPCSAKCRIATSTICSRRPRDRSGARGGSCPAAITTGTVPDEVRRRGKKNPRDLRLAGSRSFQPPLAPRAQVLRATSGNRLGFLAVDPFVGLWGLPSYPYGTASWLSQPSRKVAHSWPYGFPRGPALGSLTRPLRLLGARRNVTAGRRGVNPKNAQVTNICAGRRHRIQSDKKGTYRARTARETLQRSVRAAASDDELAIGCVVDAEV